MIATYTLCAILFLVGLYGVVRRKNLIKVIIGIAIMVQSVGLVFVVLGYSEGGVGGISQTMGLVALIGGLAVMTLMIATSIRLHQKYGTSDISEIRRLKG